MWIFGFGAFGRVGILTARRGNHSRALILSRILPITDMIVTATLEVILEFIDSFSQSNILAGSCFAVFHFDRFFELTGQFVVNLRKKA